MAEQEQKDGGDDDDQKPKGESQEARAKRIIKVAQEHVKKNPELYDDKWYIPDTIEDNYDCYTLAYSMSTGSLDTGRIIYDDEFELKG